MVKMILLVVIFIIGLGFSYKHVFSQQEAKIEFSKLNSNDKKGINKSINVLSKHMLNERWAKVYDLLVKDTADFQSKEEFVKEMKDRSKNKNLTRRVVGFVAKDYLVLNDKKMHEKVNVSGCVEVEIKKRKYKYLGTVDVGRNGSEKWLFFSLPYVNPDSTAGGPVSCSN